MGRNIDFSTFSLSGDLIVVMYRLLGTIDSLKDVLLRWG